MNLQNDLENLYIAARSVNAPAEVHDKIRECYERVKASLQTKESE